MNQIELIVEDVSVEADKPSEMELTVNELDLVGGGTVGYLV